MGSEGTSWTGDGSSMAVIWTPACLESAGISIVVFGGLSFSRDTASAIGSEPSELVEESEWKLSTVEAVLADHRRARGKLGVYEWSMSRRVSEHEVGAI